jgi:MurNAc alpha-1-phosphate uridylyltransferase
MIAMILAAGRGERLRPITENIPKALVEVRGECLIERHLANARAAGVDTVVINLGWLGEKIADRVGSGSKYGLNVVYSPEGENILETGGGVHRALPMLGADPFLVINSDIYSDMPLPSDDLGSADMGQLMLVPKPAYRSGGDFDLVDTRVRNSDHPESTFAGVAVYRPEFFAACNPGRFSLAPMLIAAADQGSLRGEIYRGLWEDVGTPERLAALNA